VHGCSHPAAEGCPPSHPLDVCSPLANDDDGGGGGGGGGARADDVHLRFRPQARKATAATAESLPEAAS